VIANSSVTVTWLWSGRGAFWCSSGEGAQLAQTAGQEAAGIGYLVGPCPAGAAHVGLQGSLDVVSGPHRGVNAGAGERIANRSRVTMSQRWAAHQDLSCQPLQPQWSRLGAPAPAFVGGW